MFPHLSTPLGELTFQAVFGGQLARQGSFIQEPQGRFVQLNWETTEVQGWVRTGTVNPDLLPGQHVDGCTGVFWEVRAQADLPDHSLSECTLSWTGSPSWSGTGWYGGQSVWGQSWWHGDTRVSVGTPDPEGSLAHYAAMGSLVMPGWWLTPLVRSGMALSNVHVHSGAPGLSVRFPRMQAGDICQGFFGVAWNHWSDSDSAETEDAADLSPTQFERSWS